MGGDDGISKVNGYDVFGQETVPPAEPDSEDEDGADG